MSACASCKAKVKWVVVKKSGKRMPIDPEPVDGGNVEVVGSRVDGDFGRCELVIVHPKGSLPMPGMGKDRFRSHFASCPNADHHRRR